jgi:hypothetical protein
MTQNNDQTGAVARELSSDEIDAVTGGSWVGQMKAFVDRVIDIVTKTPEAEPGEPTLTYPK